MTDELSIRKLTPEILEACADAVLEGADPYEGSDTAAEDTYLGLLFAKSKMIHDWVFWYTQFAHGQKKPTEDRVAKILTVWADGVSFGWRARGAVEDAERWKGLEE